MPRPFALPDLGEGLQEAEIVKVLVADGDTIAEDAPLLEVETDKAQVEIPSPMGGRVEKVHVRAGDTVRVGQVLVTFADADGRAGRRDAIADAREIPNTGRDAAPPAEKRAAVEPPSERVVPTAEAVAPTGPVPATPATRRLAREVGVDIRTVRGRAHIVVGHTSAGTARANRVTIDAELSRQPSRGRRCRHRAN